MTSPCACPRLCLLDLRNRPFRPLSPSALTPGTVLCLGNFDGVHPAHAAILREGVRQSRRVSEACLCGAFCFFRPSSDYRPDRPAVGEHLTTLREKLLLLSGCGLDFVCLCAFPEVRDMSPDDFIRLLCDVLHCRGTVCGFNYRFGARGQGTPDRLRGRFGESAVILPEMRADLPDGVSVTVSSSRIRALLGSGDPASAAVLLGRPYALASAVVYGKQLGRTVGFPTANQYFPAGRLVPRRGVYAVRVTMPGGVFPGVANVGTRPTVDSQRNVRVNCETYIIGFSGNLYGQRIRVEFFRFLRPEQRFDGIDALTAAIRHDAAEAAALAGAPRPPRPDGRI